MTETKRLIQEARESADGEAYAAIAKDEGFRLGMGARTAPDGGFSVFVEVVLDPFPHRPRVHADFLAAESRAIARLETRGYTVTCDQDSTITCERTVGPKEAAREVEAVLRLLTAKGDGSRSRSKRHRRT